MPRNKPVTPSHIADERITRRIEKNRRFDLALFGVGTLFEAGVVDN